MPKYDCVLVVTHMPTKSACRQEERDKLHLTYTGYYIRLDASDTVCLIRKAHDRPPVPKDGWLRKSLEEDPDYMHSILDYLQEIAKCRKEGLSVAKRVDGGYEYSLHSLNTGKHSVEEFMDMYETSIVLAKIMGDS